MDTTAVARQRSRICRHMHLRLQGMQCRHGKKDENKKGNMYPHGRVTTQSSRFPNRTIYSKIGCGSPTYIKKKRGNLYLSLVPRFKAFALPSKVERATQKPTPICTCLSVPSTTRKHTKGFYTHPADTYHCFVLDFRLRSCEVLNRQKQNVK